MERLRLTIARLAGWRQAVGSLKDGPAVSGRVLRQSLMWRDEVGARQCRLSKGASAPSAVTAKGVTDASEIVAQEITLADSACNDRLVCTQRLLSLVRFARSPRLPRRQQRCLLAWVQRWLRCVCSCLKEVCSRYAFVWHVADAVCGSMRIRARSKAGGGNEGK